MRLIPASSQRRVDEELGKVYAQRYGSGIRPDVGAVPVTAEARAEQGLGPSVDHPV